MTEPNERPQWAKDLAERARCNWRGKSWQAWGTFCPVCLTVRTSSPNVVCHGGDRACERHEPTTIVVLEVPE